MSKKNRLEQPYGYREQDKYISGPAMICDAIKGKLSAAEIAEQLSKLAGKTFTGVRYDRTLESFVFTNLEGTDIDAVKLQDVFVSDLISDVHYNPNTKNIVIKFDNGDRIKLPLGDVVSQMEDEVKARESGDSEIWDAIGDLTNSDKTIAELLSEEKAARESGDSEIWDTINNLNMSDETLSGLVNNEKTERENADKELETKIDQEISDRESGDSEIWDAIGDLTNASEDGDKTIAEMLSEEKAAREAGDSELNTALENEIERAKGEEERLKTIIGSIIDTNESDNISLTDMIKEEMKTREEEDNKLSEALEKETEDRNSVEQEIWNAVNDETSTREQVEGQLWSTVNGETARAQEIEGQLWNAVNGETARAQGVEGQLWSAVNGETQRASSVESQLWEGINSEASRAKKAEGDLSDALDEEIAERKADSEDIRKSLASVKIESIAPTSAKVRESYKLTNDEGETLGDVINIYKDTSLKEVELVGEKDGKSGQYLKFTYLLDDGSDEIVLLDVSSFLVESEFKNGLKVNGSGEVNVEIDEASEEYLSVSAQGLKISGIDSIKADLDNERKSREAGDIAANANLTEEQTAREQADNELDKKILAEQTARENADNGLDTKISDEQTARENADKALEGKITAEQTARENADNELETKISDEKTARETAVSGLQTQVDTLNGGLETEKSERAAKDTEIENTLRNKANSIDVYYKGEADEKFATKSEIPTDFYSKEYINGKLEELGNGLTAETQSREAGDADILKQLTAETKSRTDADSEIQDSIDTINATLSDKIGSLATNGTAFAINKDGGNATIDLKLSTDKDQMLKFNSDGLYAKATLTYDEDINTLFFNTSNSETMPIKLKSKLVINEVRYSRATESITIDYSVNGQRMESVSFSVADLINEWRVWDGHDGAIELEKSRELSSEQDVLKARVVISSHEDNVIMNDGGALYVSKEKIIGDLEKRIEALEAKIGTSSTMDLMRQLLQDEDYLEDV